MSRSYAAARREYLGEPITFDVSHVEQVPQDPASSVAGEGQLVQERVVVTTFTCRGRVSTMLLSEFAAQADVDAATPEGMALLAMFFRQAFGDEKEYGRFFRFATAHLDDDELMGILRGLLEDFTARPTKGSSDSPGGPSSTGSTSKAVSSPSTSTGVTVIGELDDADLAVLTAARTARETQAQQASSV